jgi:imidazolonepropionase-like amidohydrolase
MYAGTDAGGVGAHGRIGDEIVALGAIGGADFALGAASWRARDWLGRPCLAEGERADLVAYTSDPRQDLAVVLSSVRGPPRPDRGRHLGLSYERLPEQQMAAGLVRGQPR